MRYIFLMALLLTGCSLNNTDEVDRDHELRLLRLEVDRLREVNSVLIEADTLSNKAVMHIFDRLKELEHRNEGSVLKDKSEPSLCMYKRRTVID